MNGLRLAVGWLTVLPVRSPERVDAATARDAIRWAPVVGVLLGAGAAGGAVGLDAMDAPPLLIGVLVVAALALATRGMHLDGLADTADGLGCYAGPQRSLEVMRDGSAGPFAVITLVLILLAQIVAVASLVDLDAEIAIGVAVCAGRVAFGWCCRSGVPAARPDGLGALVAGTQPIVLPVLWAAALAGTATTAVPDRGWLGPLAVALAAAAVILLSRQTIRRFGGITGDVLGAASELAVTVVLVTCALG